MSRKPEQNIVILGCRKEPSPWVRRSKTSVDIEPPKIKATISDVNSHIARSPEIFQKRISLVKTDSKQVKFDDNSGDSESSPKLNPPFLSGIIKSRKTSPEKFDVGSGYLEQQTSPVTKSSFKLIIEGLCSYDQNTDSPIKKFTEFITSWFTQKSKINIEISEKNALFTSAAIQEHQKLTIDENKRSEKHSNYIFSMRNEKPKNMVIIPFSQMDVVSVAERMITTHIQKDDVGVQTHSVTKLPAEFDQMNMNKVLQQQKVTSLPDELDNSMTVANNLQQLHNFVCNLDWEHNGCGIRSRAEDNHAYSEGRRRSPEEYGHMASVPYSLQQLTSEGEKHLEPTLLVPGDFADLK